ncbi:MAG: alpha-glucosidase [Anaerolineae bacterium]|nr:alpha-glucosidase [Anaerolineae bacterium]
MNKRIVLIGAGSAQFGYGTMGDIFQSKVLEGSHVVLHDINPNTLAVVAKAGQAFIDEHKLPFTLSATTSRPEALQGADFCISSIEVGNRFELWEQDWRIPQQFGIRQVYGENGGPGGLFHSLRILPPILAICDDVVKICPQAHVFNFSNPMSRICTTVHRKYPDLSFTGLCHEIGSLPRHLPKILGVPSDKLWFRAGGLNHFSVLLECTYKDTGEDAYPAIREKAPAYFEDLPTMRQVITLLRQARERHGEEWEQAVHDEGAVQRELGTIETAHKWAERGLFKVILEKFGYLPITTDSHFGEYIQWAYDAVDHAGILDFYIFYKGFLSQVEPRKIELRLTERVIPIIEGILTDSGYEEAAVNVPNKGAIADLPDWLVVEVPGRVNKGGVHGIELPGYPRGVLGLLQNQVAVHDMTAEAVLSGSKAAVLQALLVDPIVDKCKAAEELLDTMLELQKDYLGYIK